MTAYRHGSTRPPTSHGIAERPAVDRFGVDPAELAAWTAEVAASRRAYDCGSPNTGTQHGYWEHVRASESPCSKCRASRNDGTTT